MNKVITLTFASSLSNLREVNSSFDSGVLQIAYHGKNRNGSFISKETFERCIKTMYNCPIVCNYDLETDTFGGHDVDIVSDNDGGFRMINLTDPVGVIPESAKWWWGSVTEDDGEENEYLFAECLIWKRQPAYKKIVEDGTVSHSMEIKVKEGHAEDGVFYVDDFEFNAFALIGVTPCFESSALQVFSSTEFKEQLSKMMQELEETFTMVYTSSEDDNTHPHDNSTKGGAEVLEEKIELVAKYGINTDDLDFSIEDFTVEELIEKFEAMKTNEESDAIEADNQNEDEHDAGESNEFALSANLREEIMRSLSTAIAEEDWGSYPQYSFVDYDSEKSEVYAWDQTDWLLYGFGYEMNGDSVVIDWESKRRVKYVIADFDEGEQESPFANVLSLIKEKLRDYAELSNKYQTASENIETLNSELNELKEFKVETENAISKAQHEEILSNFDDLNGVEAFEELRKNCMEYSLDVLEEKCFAIRGRNGAVIKFSIEENKPKIMVDRSLASNKAEPYNGVFAEFGIDKE